MVSRTTIWVPVTGAPETGAVDRDRRPQQSATGDAEGSSQGAVALRGSRGGPIVVGIARADQILVIESEPLHGGASFEGRATLVGHETSSAATCEKPRAKQRWEKSTSSP